MSSFYDFIKLHPGISEKGSLLVEEFGMFRVSLGLLQILLGSGHVLERSLPNQCIAWLAAGERDHALALWQNSTMFELSELLFQGQKLLPFGRLKTLDQPQHNCHSISPETDGLPVENEGNWPKCNVSLGIIEIYVGLGNVKVKKPPPRGNHSAMLLVQSIPISWANFDRLSNEAQG